MKANELMIDDWVWYNNQPHQIRQLGIFGENRDGDDYPAVCVGKPNGVGLILERNEIEPIPLTPEILEKNGFEYFHKNYSSLSYDHPFKLKMTNWPDGNGLGGLWTICDIVEIRFVHQLQHALRLCEIEKEIVL